MSSLVIVAIPAETDRVWQVSSEKVPHLTLLYLGENSASKEMIEFLEHAASTALNRFGLDVDRRGTLGEDKADVLYFSDGWEAKDIKQFRHHLLQNEEIQKAYASVEQFDEWQPHLTLGYPESPAKPTPTDYGLSWVRFDRIALWVDNYEGPEFTLKNNNSMEVSMSDFVTDFLTHHGVKGMKWGVRKDKGHEGERVKTKKLAKLDKKFDKKTASAATYTRIHNEAAVNFNKNIVAINKKYEAKDLGFDPFSGEYKSAAGKAYIREAQKLADAGVKKALDNYGMNPSGTKRLEGRGDALSGTVQYYWVEVKHATESEPILEITFDISETGLISGIKPSSVAHTAVESILEHHGVKGMKWGVRRNRVEKAAGPKSTDAKRADKNYAKAKSKGTASLSNKQLKDLNERLRLEQQFKQVDPQGKTRSEGRKFVEQQIKTVIGMGVGAAASKHLIKRIV